VSGFFETLAARARGEALVVRPRLPSRFESEAPETLDLSGETLAERLSPPEPAATHPAEPLRAPPVATHPIEPSASRAAALPDAPRPAASAEALSPLVTPAPPAPRSAEVRLDPPDFAHPEPAAARPLDAPGRVTTAPAPKSRDERPPPAARRIAAPDAIQPETRSATDAARTLAEPALPVAPPPRKLNELEPHPPRTRAERRAAALTPPREETTVHVSIGRIEVRAAQPVQETKRKEPPRPAVMSLEDYLQSRRGRR